MDVHKDEYLSLVELGDVLKELSCTIGETEGIIIINFTQKIFNWMFVHACSFSKTKTAKATCN